jgi:SAM-dependent methyltransferase
VAKTAIKQEVRQFYDSVGWQLVDDELYQNARYEDLRSVSRPYLQRCHARVGRYLPEEGEILLDAGSGPIQYPEYLEYSKGFRHRLCLDISIQALREARRRIGSHGLFVVGDIAHLPLRTDSFDGLVSLHTIHHLPPDEHEMAFREFLRVLRPGGKAVVVYSWGSHSQAMRWLRGPMRPARWALRRRRLAGAGGNDGDAYDAPEAVRPPEFKTYTYKHDYRWVKRHLQDLPCFEVRVWRSVSTVFLRTFIHPAAFGRAILNAIYGLEEMLPHLLGRLGQYPMILFCKERRPSLSSEGPAQ